MLKHLDILVSLRVVWTFEQSLAEKENIKLLHGATERHEKNCVLT